MVVKRMPTRTMNWRMTTTRTRLSGKGSRPFRENCHSFEHIVFMPVYPYDV